MIFIFNIIGPSLRAASDLAEKLIPFLKESGLSIGVTVQRRLDSAAAGAVDVKTFSRAGADQVMDTRGKEGVAYNKRGGITPLIRIAARYFSSVDILIGIGYTDPGPAVAVYPDGIPVNFAAADTPGLLAVVADKPALPLSVPVFPPGEENKLAGLLLDRLENPGGRQG